MRTLSNLNKVYTAPDSPTEITLNGASILSLNPIEVMVQPDNWGYVLVEKPLGSGPNEPVKKWVDGQTKNYTYWGEVSVTFS